MGWESTRVSIKYNHSDNSVFLTEVFTDVCKEEGQSLSFNDVGA